MARNKNQEPRIRSTIRKDFRDAKFKSNLSSEYSDLKDYFLSVEKRDRLQSMGGCRKFFKIPWWMIKSLYLRLTPFRRILLLFGSVFLIFSSCEFNIQKERMDLGIDFPALFSGLIFLFILALELKDKLTAKTELMEGRAVQKALLPSSTPNVKGWDIWFYSEPANDVGGDLIDILKINENTFGISLGDVAGKGLTAALLMSKLQSTIRAVIPEYQSLSEIGERLNKIFYRDSLPHLFASLIYLELKTDSGVVRFLNAGHIPPVIKKKDKIIHLHKNSPALGILPDASFAVQQTELSSGEFIIVYSDGLSEAQNEAGEFLDQEKLDELFNFRADSARSLGEKIIAVMNTFIGSAKQHDDLTIAVLRKV